MYYSGIDISEPITRIGIALLLLISFLSVTFTLALYGLSRQSKSAAPISTFWTFCYACFLKPHNGDGDGNQQDALESFYQAQASIYDATRSRLLRGREDMLGLVAAQLKHRVAEGAIRQKPVWVDVSLLVSSD